MLRYYGLWKVIAIDATPHYELNIAWYGGIVTIVTLATAYCYAMPAPHYWLRLRYVITVAIGHIAITPLRAIQEDSYREARAY